MKRKPLTFALAALTVGLLGSCSKINERLDNLEKEMIQTVTIIPAYSDGSVEANEDTLTVNCIVEPAAAVATIGRDSVRVLVATVNKTKSATCQTVVPAEISKTPATGELTVKADISDITPAEGKALMVALKLSNGISKYTTEFVGVTLPSDALPGKFTVNFEGKQVNFSKGNLIATVNASGAPTAWKFATKQYDYLGNVAANNSIGTTAGDVDLFCWSTDAAYNNWGIHTKTPVTADYTDGDFKDWGTAYCKSNGIKNATTWRTLTTDEWQYLFNFREVNGDTGEGYSYQRAQINSEVSGGVYGLILYPDNYTETAKASYSSAEWTSLEDTGCVFLPAACNRKGSDVDDTGDFGCYWSSSAYDSIGAYVVFFDGDFAGSDYHTRDLAFSVRLITEVEE